MVTIDISVCPDCGGNLRYYDSVKRIVRTRYGKTNFIKVRRLKCDVCKKVHRELPDYILPFKHYEADIIFGVVEGLISPDVLGFEDYPCQSTINEWLRTQNLQLIL